MARILIVDGFVHDAGCSPIRARAGAPHGWVMMQRRSLLVRCRSRYVRVYYDTLLLALRWNCETV
jgi:hypothetical protein